MKNKRRITGSGQRPVLIIVIVVCLAAVAWLVATRPGANGKPVVTVIGEDSSNVQALESLKSDFEGKFPISLQFSRNTYEVALQKANQDLVNGTALYDIVCQYGNSLASFVQNDYVLTLKDMERIVPSSEASRAFETDIFPNVWKEGSFFRVRPGAEPEAIGYPFAAVSMVLVYNKTLFDEPRHKSAYRSKYNEDLAPPKTWESYRRIAEYFTPSDASTAGLVLQGGSGGWIFWEWCNFAFSMGGGVMKKNYGWDGDEKTPLLLTTPETIAATKQYIALKPFNTGDFFSVGAPEQREILLSPKKPVAMAIMWTDYIFDITKGPRGREFGFAPIPGDKTMSYGATFFINKKSKHPREAIQYILYLMGKDVQVKLMEKGLGSAFRSVYDAPEVKALPYSDALRQTFEKGVYMVEAGPGADAIQEAITKQLQKMWKGEIEVEAGLKAAQAEIEEKRKEIFSAKKL